MGIPIGNSPTGPVYHPQNQVISNPPPQHPYGWTPPTMQSPTSVGYPNTVPRGPVTNQLTGTVSSPTTPAPVGAEDLYWQWARRQLGVTPAFGTSGYGSTAKQILELSSLAPIGGGEIALGEGAAHAPGLLARAWTGLRGEQNAARALSYPTGAAPASKYALSRLGEHAGFGPDVQYQRQVMAAPSVDEHLSQMGNLSAQRGGFIASPSDILGQAPTKQGAIPAALDRLLWQEQYSPAMQNALTAAARGTDRPVPEGFVNNPSRSFAWQNPDIVRPKVPMMPSDNTPEGLALHKMMGDYYNAGGTRASDSGLSGLQRPLWQRGEGTPGDLLSTGRGGAENARNTMLGYMRDFRNKTLHYNDPAVPGDVRNMARKQYLESGALESRLQQNRAASKQGPLHFFSNLFGANPRDIVNELDNMMGHARAAARGGDQGWPVNDPMWGLHGYQGKESGQQNFLRWLLNHPYTRGLGGSSN